MTAITAMAQAFGYKNSRYADVDDLDIYRFVVYIIAQFKCTESKIQMYKN